VSIAALPSSNRGLPAFAAVVSRRARILKLQSFAFAERSSRDAGAAIRREHIAVRSRSDSSADNRDRYVARECIDACLS
jgi:hypothetical protein